MKPFFHAGVLVLLVVVFVPGQERPQIYSQPSPPPREALDRLNLQLAWAALIPTEGRRDGLATVQLTGKQVLIQTRSGLITVLDADTGRTVWRARVGNPYPPTLDLGYNARSVFVVNGTYLFALDRASGSLQWRFSLPGGIAAPAAADENQLFLCTSTRRAYGYLLPLPEAKPSGEEGSPGAEPAGPSAPAANRPGILKENAAKVSAGLGYLSAEGAKGRDDPNTIHPFQIWSQALDFPPDMPPQLFNDVVLLSSSFGKAQAVEKAPAPETPEAVFYRFSAQGNFTAPPGRYEATAYFGSQDSNVYALNIPSGKVEWRFTAGDVISRRPMTTEQDVYVASERNGLTRLDRATGNPVWRVPRGRGFVPYNFAAERFLAANPKFVYAADHSGRLLVLDRERGGTLSSLDVRDFVVPIANDVSDRIFLAANNGLLLCLHDRSYPAPFKHRKGEEVVAEPGKPVLPPAAQELQEKLKTPVNEPGGDPSSLRTVLNGLMKRYKIRIQVSLRAYKEATLDDPIDRQVTPVPAENMPLGDLLQKLLDQVDSTYTVFGDDILIVPKPKKAP